MHEVSRSRKHILAQKFHQKPQNFSETPKPRFQNRKMHENERFKAYQGKKTGKSLKKPWGRCLEWVREV